MRNTYWPQVAPAPPLVFVISGPSGVGKDAVIKQLQHARPNLHFVVTATSRQVKACVHACISARCGAIFSTNLSTQHERST